MNNTDLARKRLGERIAELRKKQKMTQRQLSEKCGLNPAYLNRAESGKINLTINKLALIADALRCHVDLIWGKEDELE